MALSFHFVRFSVFVFRYYVGKLLFLVLKVVVL